MALLLVANTAAAVQVVYSYDSLNRITNVDYGNGSVINYTYDSAGNRLTYSGAVANDAIAPTISITSPTSGLSYTNGSSTISLSGTASDNVGVTTVIWSDDRGGIGVATGTNNWGITSIPLKYGVNNITVTAYDAAGNSTPAILAVTFAPGSRSSGTTTNTVFSDNFNGNTIDPTKWTTSGNNVLQTNGTMEVLTTVTDAGGSLTSVAIPVNSTGKITITRQVFVHYGYPDFEGQFGITIGSLPQFGIRYANMTYSDGVTYQACYGFILVRNGARPDVIADQGDVGPAIAPLWDTWFNEKLTYDPLSGIMEYFINGISQTNYNVGILSQTNSSPTMSLFFSAWGWFTGHEQLFSNLVVSQVVPASVSVPLNQITGYRFANGIFHFALSAPPGSNYVIYASTDLKYWTPMATNAMPSGGLITFVDSNASQYPHRFYRAVPLGTVVTEPPGPPSPELTEIGVNVGGSFQFNLNGPMGSNYVIQASSNLMNWVNVSTNSIPSGGVSGFSFPISPSQPQMFYRALPAP